MISRFLLSVLLIVLAAILHGQEVPRHPPPATTATAQSLPAAAAAARAAERITALQKEADNLARQEKSLLVDLRRLEVERDLKVEQARQADAQVTGVGGRIAETTERIRSLQAAIDAARPGLEARLVDAYKLGRPGYARLLLSVNSVTEMARATRMVAAMAQLDGRRVTDYTAAVTRLNAEHASLGRQSAELKALQAKARDASSQASRAATARAQLVQQIDARRDLNAQMVAELQAAQDRLTKTFAALPASSTEDPTHLPLRPFRGALDWPASGRLNSRYGAQFHHRFGTRTLQNGIEIGTAEGAPVRAIHEGRVAFAGSFSGFGQLVIVDHGSLAYSLYGYLSSVGVIKGARVGKGQALGSAGLSPGGNPALYFELRIDGKPVDPLQWLKANR